MKHRFKKVTSYFSHVLNGEKIIPFSAAMEKKKGKGFYHKGLEYIHYSDLQYDQTAFFRLSPNHKVIFGELLAIFTLSLLLNWHFTVVVLISILTCLYFIDLLFNLFLVSRSFSSNVEIAILDKATEKIPEKNWPSYTILCPLYKEWQVVSQFVTAISRLDYPKDKLQVLLLLEEDDTETIRYLKKYTLPGYFQIVIVPNSQPKTKPKACNYGLIQATGDYTVIYDAEDIPDPLQLKKAVMAFKKGGYKIACVQAKLNFYNPQQNVLSRMFTAEYSLWFDLVLTGLQSIDAPIPLGGTSNHFQTSRLKKLKGWDSFNVTEDCDLGMRLVKAGYRTAIIDSVTLEEANSSYRNWIVQRGRWIKGYMQTYLVHSRSLSDFTNKNSFAFQMIVGGKVLSMFINPLMWVITFSYFMFRAHVGTFIESFFPSWVLYLGVFSLMIGNFLYMYYYMIGCARHGHDKLVRFVFLIPFYWLGMSIAAWYATYKLITAPHHWAKTQHGLHIDNTETPNKGSSGTILNPIPANISYAISGVSIVLPAYNEEENIVTMVNSVFNFMQTLKLKYEIIIVNDGSYDKTKKLINQLVKRSSKIKGIHHPKNYGYGAALRSGFAAAKKDWIFFTDSDMQFDIAEIVNFLNKTHEAELILGYRENRQDPFIRVLNANLYKLSLQLLFGLHIKDIDCAFKLFSREVILKHPLQASGALINAEMLIKAKRAKYKMTQVGVTHYPRVKGNPTGAKFSVIVRAMKELISFRLINTI